MSNRIKTSMSGRNNIDSNNVDDDEDLDMKTIIIDPKAGIPVGQVVYRCALCRKICESPHMATLHYQVDHIEVLGVNYNRVAASKNISGTSLLANNINSTSNANDHYEGTSSNHQRNHSTNSVNSSNKSNQHQNQQRSATGYNTQTKPNSINQLTRSSGTGSSINNINNINKNRGTNSNQIVDYASNNNKQTNNDRAQSQASRSIEVARRNICSNVNNSVATKSTSKTIVRAEKKKPVNGQQSMEYEHQNTVGGTKINSKNSAVQLASTSTEFPTQHNTSIISTKQQDPLGGSFNSNQSCSTTGNSLPSTDKQKTIPTNKNEEVSQNTVTSNQSKRSSRGSPETIIKGANITKHATRYSTSRNQTASSDIVSSDIKIDSAAKTLRTRNSVYSSLDKKTNETGNQILDKNEELTGEFANQDESKHIDQQQPQNKNDSSKSLRSQSSNRALDKTDGAKASTAVSPTTSADSTNRKRHSNRSSSLNSSRRNSIDSTNGADTNPSLLADSLSKNPIVVEKASITKSGKKRRGAPRWTVKKRKAD